MSKEPTTLLPKQKKTLEIDWHAQWQGVGWTERNGHFEVDLQPILGLNAGFVKMLPGAGFGDLSHATTTLTLQMMAPHLAGKTLVDIGCGSGILSIAAAHLGMRKGIGIDIDPLAVQHATANAKLNGFDASLSFYLPTETPLLSEPASSLLFVMNMIYTEQQVAWESLQHLHRKGVNCITSGILVEHDEHYLAICHRLGWRLVSTLEKNGWLAFHFIT